MDDLPARAYSTGYEQKIRLKASKEADRELLQTHTDLRVADEQDQRQKAEKLAEKPAENLESLFPGPDEDMDGILGYAYGKQGVTRVKREREID